MKQTGFRWTLNPMTDGLTRRGQDAEREDRAKTETVTGIILPRAKECQEPSEAGRIEGGSSPEPSEGAWPHQHPHLGPLASSIVREKKCYC